MDNLHAGALSAEGSPNHALVCRRDAAQATLDRFGDQPFTWGKRDCCRMVAFHLKLLGYRPQLAKGGTYSSLLGATRALARAGVESLAAALDALSLPRIAPAAAIVGDIIAIPSEGPLDALAVALGNGRALAYHQDLPNAVVVQPLEMVAAWRVDPR